MGAARNYVVMDPATGKIDRRILRRAGNVVSTRPFIFHGHDYDFRSIMPGGLTLFNTVSVTR